MKVTTAGKAKNLFITLTRGWKQFLHIFFSFFV